MTRRCYIAFVFLLGACGARSELGVPEAEDSAAPPSDASAPIDVAQIETAPAVEASVDASIDVLQPPLLPVLAAGIGHVCALLPTGAVKCWGDNTYGEIGDGTTINRTVPTDVVGLSSGVVAIGAGPYHSCAVLQDGSVRCWGENLGQLGDGTTLARSTPVAPIGFIGSAVAIVGGGNFTCALLSSGQVECWGAILGGAYDSPNIVSDLGSNVAAITADSLGELLVLARKTSGDLECWNAKVVTAGDCLSPQGTKLGFEPVVDMNANANVPVYVSSTGALENDPHIYDEVSDDGGNLLGPDGPVTRVAVMQGATCAILPSGIVECWGGFGYSLGGGKGAGDFVDVVGITSAVSITAGRSFACVVLSSGSVECWGYGVGVLGNGSTMSSYVPVSVVGIP